MSDGLLPLSPATAGGKIEDVEDLIGAAATPVIRQRNQVVGALLIEIARVMNLSPDGTEYALATRNIPATLKTSSLTGTPINISAAGDNTIVAGVALQTIRAFKLFFVAAAPVEVKFKDGAGVDLTPYMPLTANGSFVLDFDTQPWLEASAGNDFIINLSAPVQVSGRLQYQQSA